MVRVAYYDPGRTRDMFGMVAAEITKTEILYLNAKEWPKTNFLDAEKEIEEINKKHPFDYHFCETNNQGWHVIDNLRRINKIPVRGINTGRGLVDIEKIRAGNTMDKPKIVEWTEWAREKGIIKMPIKPWSRGIVSLNQQLDNFGMIFKNGTVKYEAIEGHDDLAMCAFGINHVAKTKFLSLSGRNTLIGIGGGDPEELERNPYEEAERMIHNKFADMGMSLQNIDIVFPE